MPSTRNLVSGRDGAFVKREQRQQQLRLAVQAVNRMRLIGVPTVLVVDEGALLDSRGQVPHPLLKKLSHLVKHEAMRLIVLATDFAQPQPAFAMLPAYELHGSLPPCLPVQHALAVLSRCHPLPDDLRGWYVGPGTAAPPLCPSRFHGADGTNMVLGLFGTAIVQERAGAAFRAAGRREKIPDEYPFDTGTIAAGITEAVAPIGRSRTSRIGTSCEYQVAELHTDWDQLARRAYPVIESACADSGAIAGAAPPADTDSPDYWFFWQRDAAQTAIGMTNLLSITKDTMIAASINYKLARYVGFLESISNCGRRHPDVLGIGRFTVAGEPIEGYGNPQHDSPAHSVLALTSILTERQVTRAFRIAKPFLDFLVDSGVGGLTFDLWELSIGRIFNAGNLMRKALTKGVYLAQKCSDTISEERYTLAKNMLEGQLEEFYNEHVVETKSSLIPWNDAISNLDIAVIGSVLMAYDVTDSFINVDDHRLMRTLELLEKEFEKRWPVNASWKAQGRAGMGMGRFPEDMNDGIRSSGGNPWVVTTLWASQYYFRLIERERFLNVSAVESSRASLWFQKANGYLEFVLAHVAAGSLSEQIDGVTGKERGAIGLAWAQAELIKTLAVRSRVIELSKLPAAGYRRELVNEDIDAN